MVLGVMAVSAHDEQDHEFAQVFGLDIIPVIADLDGIIPELPFVMDGILINSGKFDGLVQRKPKIA